MIRVTLANGAGDHLEHKIEPRRPGETLYDFMQRSAHEATIEARALRALLEAHGVALAAERSALVRQKRLLAMGEAIVSGLAAAALIRPDTFGDAVMIALPVAATAGLSGLALARCVRRIDQLQARCRAWRRR